MCKKYTDKRIIEQLYKTNLIKKLIDIEIISQFTIQPKAEENLETVLDESVNTINVENKREFVNVKTEIVRYSKSRGPQWKTKIEPSSFLQPIYEYGTILDIDNTQDLNKTIENREQSLNLAGVVISFENQQKIFEFCKNTLRGRVIVDPHFSCTSPLDRRDSLLFYENLVLEKSESSLILFILKGK